MFFTNCISALAFVNPGFQIQRVTSLLDLTPLGDRMLAKPFDAKHFFHNSGPLGKLFRSRPLCASYRGDLICGPGGSKKTTVQLVCAARPVDSRGIAP